MPSLSVSVVSDLYMLDLGACLDAVKLQFQEFQCCFHKPCSDGILLVPVKIVHTVGGDEPLRLVPVAQLQEFGVGHVGIAGTMGAEDGAGQFIAGA